MADPKVGIEVQAPTVIAAAELAADAERAGADSIWTPELYNRSATITLAQIAAATSRCTVGSAITYGVGRSPMTLAAEARDLDEISGGRLVLGIGNGTRRMISDWHGADPRAPARRIEELVPLLRRLWRMHTGPIHHEGRFYRIEFTPTGEVPPPLRERIPIYTAGVNPRMIESAGRVSDGLLGHPLFSRRYLTDVVRPQVDKGARHAGRDPADVAIASLVIAVADTDAERARREAAAMIAFYCSVKSYERVLEFSGFGEQARLVREAFGNRDLDAMKAAVTEEMVDALALAGTPADVRAGLTRFEGLLDHVILYVPSFEVTPERVRRNAQTLMTEVVSAEKASAPPVQARQDPGARSLPAQP